MIVSESGVCVCVCVCVTSGVDELDVGESMMAPRFTWRRLEWTSPPGDSHVEASKAGRYDDDDTSGDGAGEGVERTKAIDKPNGKWGAAAVLSHRRNSVIVTGGCASRATREPRYVRIRVCVCAHAARTLDRVRRTPCHP